MAHNHTNWWHAWYSCECSDHKHSLTKAYHSVMYVCWCFVCEQVLLLCSMTGGEIQEGALMAMAARAAGIITIVVSLVSSCIYGLKLLCMIAIFDYC